jgi:hypothetical protein
MRYHPSTVVPLRSELFPLLGCYTAYRRVGPIFKVQAVRDWTARPLKIGTMIRGPETPVTKVPTYKYVAWHPRKATRTLWPVKMGPIRCPETSVNSYHTTPHNIPEERRSHIQNLCFLNFSFAAFAEGVCSPVAPPPLLGCAPGCPVANITTEHYRLYTLRLRHAHAYILQTAYV